MWILLEDWLICLLGRQPRGNGSWLLRHFGLDRVVVDALDGYRRDDGGIRDVLLAHGLETDFLDRRVGHLEILNLAGSLRIGIN